MSGQGITQHGEPVHPALPQQQPHMMPPGSMGPGSRHQAVHLLQLGALAGARGMSEAAVTTFHGKVQDLAVQVTLASARELMELVDQVVQARLNEVAAAINGLHRTTPMAMLPPQGALSRLLNGVQQPDPTVPQPAYVSLDGVQQIIASAIAQTRNI